MGLKPKGTPYKPTETNDAHLLPEKDANEPFVFIHYPAGWTHDDAEGWLPKPARIVAKPGLNNIGRDRRIGPAMPLVMDKGGIAIQPNDARLGPWTDYIVAYDCRGGGKRYACKWQSVVILGRNQSHWEDAANPWREFRKHLRDSGIVPAMERAYLTQSVAQIGERIGRLSMRDASKPGVKENLAAAIAKRDKMIADFERLFGDKDTAPAPEASEPEPAPKAKVTPKPKVAAVDLGGAA